LEAAVSVWQQINDSRERWPTAFHEDDPYAIQCTAIIAQNEKDIAWMTYMLENFYQ